MVVELFHASLVVEHGSNHDEREALSGLEVEVFLEIFTVLEVEHGD